METPTDHKLNIAIEALKEISKKTGAFSTDPLTHAKNTIDSMSAIAEEALDKIINGEIN